MIIVAGKIYVQSGKRDTFLQRSHDAMQLAREAKGCRDFIVAADPLEADRVNVYEAWDSEDSLQAFRGAGAGSDITALIKRADVEQYQVMEGNTISS